MSMGQADLFPVSTQFIPRRILNSGGIREYGSLIMNDIQATMSELLTNGVELPSEALLPKLMSVVNENLELRETISQNNMALRQQLNLFIQWNQQVEHQQQYSRQTTDYLKTQLDSLKQENILLHSSLDLDSQGFGGNAHLYEWDKTIQNLNRQLEDKNEECHMHFNKQKLLEGEISMLKGDLAAVCKENKHLLFKVKEYASVSKTVQERLRENESNVQNFENETQQAIPIHTHFEDSAVAMGLQGSKKEGAKEDERTKLEKDKTAILFETVDALEVALAEERRNASEERAIVSRMRSEMARMKKELEDSREKLERNEFNDQYYQAKIKCIHEQHDEATAKLVSYEELLGSKNDEIARLKRELGQVKAQLTEFNSEGETITVLRAQVEVYQYDFRAEREAREALASDREKLRDELRHLHTRNTQLMDELETYQRTHYNQSSSRSPRGGSEEINGAMAKEARPLSPESLWENISQTDPKEEDPKKEESLDFDENLLYCPKCNKPFTELRPLEEHVNRCLDEDIAA